MVLAAETNLNSLLEGTKQYQVPLYQRTYSWGNKQLARLWDDVVRLTQDRLDGDSKATHFIGSMVLAVSPSIQPTGVQKFLVVDGQQRLTSLTLLLAAIRDHRTETEESNHLDRINEKYLFNKWEEGEPLKVAPTQADCESYEACIRRSHGAGGGDSIGSAYRYFKSRIHDFDDPDDELDVARLESAVLEGLSIVSVTAQAGDNVHRIFESLNNTGLRLTQGDLIRNYLFMMLPTLGDQVYRESWLPLQERLSTKDLELLFWLDLVQDDPTAKQSETYSLQQARLDRMGDEELVAQEVARLAELGSFLEIILDPSKEEDPDVRLRLQRLNEWGTTTVYPILLHLLERRDRGASTSAEIATAMLLLESYLVRRVLVGKATANINRILLGSVNEIKGTKSVSDALRDYLSTGRRYFASDDEVASASKTVSFYWIGRSTQRRLILEWIEATYDSKEPVDTSTLTIEHVLPQTLTDSWRGAIQSELEDGEDLDLVHQGILHTIGNLTLTGYNAELSNSPFEEKRELLSSSGVRMNQEIADAEHWTRSTIVERAEALTERIVDYWPGPNMDLYSSTIQAAVWNDLSRLLASIPSGAWTSYGEVAAILGTHPVPLGQRLANHPTVNAHRVLTTRGEVAENFAWIESDRADSPTELLQSEGVEFDENGFALESQRLSAEDLAELAGLDIGNAGDTSPSANAKSEQERAERFSSQLSDKQPAEVAQAVASLCEEWVKLGGQLDYGHGRLTSCFLLLGRDLPWPITIYPSGSVEVVFQHMKSREPFVDAGRRRQFMDLLNEIDGIDLPAAKLALRPSFPLDLLAADDTLSEVKRALSWYAELVLQYASREDVETI